MTNTLRQQKKLDASYKTRLKAADKAFARFIRLRDAYRYMHDNGLTLINGYPAVKCCTCKTTLPAINSIHNGCHCHAGHYIQRDRTATRFNEKNVHVQCHSCNTYQSGEQSRHGKYIDKLYGPGTSDTLDVLGNSRKGKKNMDNKVLLIIEETSNNNSNELIRYFIEAGVDPSIFK